MQSQEVQLNVLVLMEKLVDRVHAMHFGSAMGFRDSYSLEAVLEGSVHMDVTNIYAVLYSLRIRHYNNLVSSGKQTWQSYVNEALSHVNTQHLLSNVVAPRPFSVGLIGDAFRACSPLPDVGGASFVVVRGVSALLLPASRFAKHAILQVASQFNFLESKTPQYTPVDQYLEDLTQGPQASLGSLAALLIRDKWFNRSDPNAAFFHGWASCYQGGYFMPYKISDERQGRLLTFIANKIHELSIFAQWGAPDVGEFSLMQVFTAAPSYQDAARCPVDGSFGEKICALLVVEQYRAVARIAAMRSVRIKARVPLHLTLVGQGAFNNPPSVMKAAFEAVYSTVRDYEVDVFIHGYNDNDVEKITNSVPADMVLGKIMPATEFFSKI